MAPTHGIFSKVLFSVNLVLVKRQDGQPGRLIWTHGRGWPGQSSPLFFTTATLGEADLPMDISTLTLCITQCLASHGQAKTRLLYCLLQDCKMGKPWNPRNILQQGHSICAQYLSGKDRSVLQNITSCRTARALQQHYLIPMTKGLGSIITIHKTIPHLATDRERLHMELQSRPQFFLQGNFRDEAEDSHRRVDNAFLWNIFHGDHYCLRIGDSLVLLPLWSWCH